MNKHILSAIFLALFFVSPLGAQTKRALLIGIDIYQPVNNEAATTRGGWTNLDGCVNDAKAIAEIITGRFGFEQKNIRSLYNQDAKREKIIGELQHLISVASRGDVVFIYYAGHGSQVYNSLSAEEAGDKKDESIVPADMIDIRDKEMAALFNKLLDKGVILTLIFDSCHSGSIARGASVPVTFKERHVNGSQTDAKDPSDPPKPEDRGALVFSAAQPEQLAKEATDENGNPHGAFTVALIKALNSSPVNEPAGMLFLRIKAIMQSNGSNQEPVMGAGEQRRNQGLFGEDLSANAGKTMVAVLKVTDADNIELQGGWALGLNTGCGLVKQGQGNPVEITVTSVSGMARCKAKITAGNISEIKPGDLFSVTAWASPNVPNLRVWFPDCSMSYAELLKTATSIAGIRNNKSYTWITDPAIQAPDYVILFDGKTWLLNAPGGRRTDLGLQPTAESAVKTIPKNASVYLQLPPPAEIISGLSIGSGSPNNAIDITSNAANADYILAGSWQGSSISYAWIRPGISTSDSNYVSTLPVATDWLAVKRQEDLGAVAQRLTTFALRLGKVNAWLNLNPPAGTGNYPFALALKNTTTGKYLNSGTVTGGESYSLVMVTDENSLKQWDGKSRYVYVFIIDINGNTQQIFPARNTGNEGNKLPNKSYNNETELPLGNITFTITEPYGVDSYFMITSDEAINNFQAFNSEGVVNVTASRGGTSLDQLINGVGSGTRGISQTTPLSWSVQKLYIKSKPKQ